jgi:hypothetical protein
MDRVLLIALHILYCTYSLLLFFWQQLPASVAGCAVQAAGGNPPNCLIFTSEKHKTQRGASVGPALLGHGSFSLFFKEKFNNLRPRIFFFLVKFRKTATVVASFRPNMCARV